MFDPAPVEKLQSRLPGTRATFASQVCINCDARYSCGSFRAYAAQSTRRVADPTQGYLADSDAEVEQTDRLIAALDQAPHPAMLE